jgi:hypothetical protein
MLRSITRGGVALAAAAIGVAGMSLATAGSAGAVVPNASLIIGSGSQTSYDTMNTLSTLFNTAPGCDLTASTAIPLTLNCGTASTTTGTPGGAQGYNVSAENPYNDFTVQAPPVGSGNGATQLIDAGKGTPDTAVDYARASSPKGDTTDNRVAYATDGVSWITFNKVAGTATAQAKVANMTATDVKAIFNGTLSCTVKGVAYTMDWICEGAKTSSKIDVYMSQTGSGTYSTWQGYTGITKGSAGGGVTGANSEAAWPASVSAPACTLGAISCHSNLFENQMSFISQQPDAANAIYFFSYGKFLTNCPGKNSKTLHCRGTAANTFATLGAIDGIAPSTTTIAGTGPGTATFPVTRQLYNNYNNSHATVPSSQATLNFTSELGFLCKTGTSSDINPYTGNSYRYDIEAAIKSQGFSPLDVNGSPFNEIPSGTTLTYPAVLTDTAYTAIDNANTSSGYCLVTNG